MSPDNKKFKDEMIFFDNVQKQGEEEDELRVDKGIDEEEDDDDEQEVAYDEQDQQ